MWRSCSSTFLGQQALKQPSMAGPKKLEVSRHYAATRRQRALPVEGFFKKLPSWYATP
jgi:hypothetical protein